MQEQDKTILYYLCGPMTGYPELNYPKFKTYSTQLRLLGYKLISPHEIHPYDFIDMDLSWEQILKDDLTKLLTCDGIILMDGWEKSRGATLEHYVAKSLKYKIINLKDLLNENC